MKFKMAAVCQFGVIVTSFKTTYVEILQRFACVKIAFDYC